MLASIESTGPVLSALTDSGRFLLTLSMALFLSYLLFVSGALLLALVRRGRPGAMTVQPGAITVPTTRVTTVEDAA